MSTGEILITSETDAWQLLDRLYHEQLTIDEHTTIRFHGWPTIHLDFQGRDFHQSVPARLMPPHTRHAEGAASRVLPPQVWRG